MLPATTSRVAEQTPDYINERIRRDIDERVARYATLGHAAIQQRIHELDREWDIERALEVSASTVSLLGIGLGTFVRRTWFILPAVVAGFLLQHALQGWCPPVPVLRRLGVRTASEIEQERYALKVLRGDFREAESATPNVSAIVNKTLESVRT
jgi:hypothetical protein